MFDPNKAIEEEMRLSEQYERMDVAMERAQLRQERVSEGFYEMDTEGQ